MCVKVSFKGNYTLKDYRIAKYYVIRCITTDTKYIIEAIIDVGKFEDVLEVFETKDKNEANNAFKRFVEKYRLYQKNVDSSFWW